jgi:hypothetical protein
MCSLSLSKLDSARINEKYNEEYMKYKGSCHCGAVSFEIEAPEKLEVEDCNCSVCTKAGFLHLILPMRNFKLLKGREQLENYTFNTGVAKHSFCKICGIKPFYTPRSNPDGIDVNVRCLDTVVHSISIVKFDGKDWEANAHKLAHKSS